MEEDLEWPAVASLLLPLQVAASPLIHQPTARAKGEQIAGQLRLPMESPRKPLRHGEGRAPVCPSPQHPSMSLSTTTTAGNTSPPIYRSLQTSSESTVVAEGQREASEACPRFSPSPPRSDPRISRCARSMRAEVAKRNIHSKAQIPNRVEVSSIGIAAKAPASAAAKPRPRIQETHRSNNSTHAPPRSPVSPNLLTSVMPLQPVTSPTAPTTSAKRLATRA